MVRARRRFFTGELLPAASTGRLWSWGMQHRVPRCYGSLMGKSSITKPSVPDPVRHTVPGPGGSRSGHGLRGPHSAFARNLGAVIRARRRELGLTQTQLGQPLTKGFVSEVERGRSLPSLGALLLMAERLHVPVADLLGAVKEGLPAVYTPHHGNQHPAPDPGDPR
jgi:hypothetical protein